MLSQLCRWLRRGAVSAPRPEVVGAASCRPRAAAERHRGGRLRGGAGPATALGAVRGSEIQVTLLPLEPSTSF